MIFRSADELRNAKGKFAHYDSGDPDYEFVTSAFSILHDKYNKQTISLAELYKSEFGRDLQKYAENFEKPTNGIAADIQRGYIELEYFFLTLDPIFPEEYELLSKAVTSYTLSLASHETLLTSMEDTRQRRGCGSDQ